mgnify:CR=1 FL=1
MKMNKMQKTELIQKAVKARKNAYAPYSNYPVGAALYTATGKTYLGANVENAAYPVTMCAERVAIFKAVSEGEREFEMIAVVTEIEKTSERETKVLEDVAYGKEFNEELAPIQEKVVAALQDAMECLDRAERELTQAKERLEDVSNL